MPDPTYRQIAEDLRQKIESGELGRGGLDAILARCAVPGSLRA